MLLSFGGGPKHICPKPLEFLTLLILYQDSELGDQLSLFQVFAAVSPGSLPNSVLFSVPGCRCAAGG